MLKLFVPPFNYGDRVLFEIFEKSDQQISISDVANQYFELVENPQNADWIVVPAFTTSLVSEDGNRFYKEVEALGLQHNKPIALFSNSDFIVDPKLKNAKVFTPGSYAGQENQVSYPALIAYDPVEKWFNGDWKPIDPASQPSIGFCGQASFHLLKLAKDFFTIKKLRSKMLAGKSSHAYFPFFLPVFERATLLRYLQFFSGVKCNFLLRQKYKGGAKTTQHSYQIEKEFFDNIESNLFTICLRGSGNYSVRFFQTLSMGRIPIEIMTDSELPFEGLIDYSGAVLKVPYEDRLRTGKYVKEFLAARSDEQLIECQIKARKIWKDAFVLEGCLKYLALKMKAIIQEKG